jgi:hypothetical protein
MTNKTKKLFKKRAFLNPSEGIAAFEGNVVLYEREDSFDLNANLNLTDCNDGICLDFNVWTSSQASKMVKDYRKKVQRLRKLMNGFLDAVEDGYDTIEQELSEKLTVRKRRTKAKKKVQDV